MPAGTETPAKPSGKIFDATSSHKAKQVGGTGRGVRNAAISALIIFMVVNAFLWLGDGKRSKANGQGADFWNSPASIDLTVQSWRQAAARPNIVLLGSSLVMFPFWAMDKEIEPKIDSIFQYHDSIVLAKQLAAAGLPDQKIFSFAVFGEMISDAYLYVDEFLKGDKKPDCIVFGVAPRDFYDHDLPSPMATFTFQRLVSLGNFSNYAALYLPGWEKKADWLAQHLCYFYGKRWRLQLETDKAVSRAYRRLGIAGGAEMKAATSKENAAFMLMGTGEERFQNSLLEYSRRYKNMQAEDLDLQLGFLSKLLAVCQERGIAVVLVNMPITADNRALLAPGLYAQYCQKLAKLADRANVRFLDLGASPQFEKKDFWDTTHLSHIGGHKLVDHIVPAVTSLIGSK